MWAIVLSMMCTGAYGHGWMTKPISRASLGCGRNSANPNYYCESHQATMSACDLPCEGCAAYAKEGNCTPGLYPGEATLKERFCNQNQVSGQEFLDTPGEIQTSWTAGDIVEVAWVVSVNHLGSYQYRLCLDGSDTEECFKKTTLRFADGKTWHWLDSGCPACTGLADDWGSRVPLMVDKVVIPSDIQCDRCTLGWRWDAHQESSIFTSCADVTISPQSKTPFPFPTPSPTPVQDKCVTEAWQQCGGKAWSGPTCCTQGLACRSINEWYSQCEPASSHRTVQVHHMKKHAFLK